MESNTEIILIPTVRENPEYKNMMLKYTFCKANISMWNRLREEKNET